MGEIHDAPNQQVVRADGSGPWDEGEGGSAPEPEPEPQATQQAEQAQQTEQQQPEKPAGRRKRSAEDPVLPDRQDNP